MIDTAFVLAAGRGQRLGEMTQQCPKPLLPVADSTIIERLLVQLSAAGVTNILMNVSYLWEQIVERLKDGRNVGCSIDYSLEAERLETAGGIIAGINRLPEQFLVINADVVTDFPFSRLKKHCLKPGLDGHLVFVPNPPINPRGDYALLNETVILGGDSEETHTFSGISILSQSFFAGVTPGPRPLSQLFQAKIAQGKLTGELYSGMWHDVGSVEGLVKARASVEKVKGTAE
ncbi:MAG: mannose-1-phosphate guanylyltransferase [Legionellales bacterium]|nr:mannose-1-phosphate guanylyltransferase [Legionellales bacterium]|tara:strand:- start:228 stop:923 length:696 start_codon:yes stop_codon:yes gene_type:complete